MVTRVHSDLVISRESVHEVEKVVANRGVHYKVDPRYGKAIFWTGSVDIGEVNAESPFSIRLFDEDYITQPVRVFYFSDSFGLEEFINFFIDRLLPFWGVTPSFFYVMGLKEGLMFSLCVITTGLIPPISSCFQANTSIFYFKKWIRRSITSLTKLDSM